MHNMNILYIINKKFATIFFIKINFYKELNFIKIY
jgi:hypothetical protein